ncbi:MAG: hypothetical protein IPH52_16205 [Leptospiraceae bacterium]|nr:hypothetical protein [Leptospiraceae bacterium]
MDANYVGIHYELNQEYAIYQRMRYDYIEPAIKRNCGELRFGRTAKENHLRINTSIRSISTLFPNRLTNTKSKPSPLLTF